MTVPLAVGALILAVLIAGWILYPLALSLLPRQPTKSELHSPDGRTVTVVIATRDQPALVAARVDSLLTTTWPCEQLRIVVAIDRNAIASLEDYRDAMANGPVKIVPGDDPGGKAATLNAAMRAVATPIVIFADTAQQFSPSAIGALVAALRAPNVGGVTGEIATDAENGVFALFWRYELMLRKLESRLGLVVNFTGAIHAIRYDCWRPLPPGLICDDLLIPLQIGRHGWRTEVAPCAQARDPRPMSREVQLRRKIRTMTGVLQLCRWEPWVLLPWRQRMWIAFVCHKLIRTLTPMLVIVLMAALALVLPVKWLRYGAEVVVAIGALGLLGLVLIRRPIMPVLREIGWFVRMLGAPLVATGRALRGDWKIW